ncbi:MAG TPA: GTPase, partial [Gaiellaceae bacterium]|nr:GTPase [Gaiellaceae bacterium]
MSTDIRADAGTQTSAEENTTAPTGAPAGDERAVGEGKTQAGEHRSTTNRASAGGAIPVVALVGRPNVGKSALFNRMVGDESAIVSEEAGTTRDRHFGRVDWGGRSFWLVDTGGLPEKSDIPMDTEIRKQVLEAIEEADLLLLVVDNKVGVHPSDHRVLDLLRDAHK